MAPKQTLGRQKIEMKKIEDEESLQICFSKRRKGLFKKAAELCTLTGAELILLVYSPSGKPFTFGQPNVNEVIDRFLNQAPPPPPDQDLGRQYRILAQERTDECRQLAMTMKEKKERYQSLEEGLREFQFKNPYKYGKDAETMTRGEVKLLVHRLHQAYGEACKVEDAMKGAPGASSSTVPLPENNPPITVPVPFPVNPVPVMPSVGFADSSNINPASTMDPVDALLGGDLMNLTNSPDPFDMFDQAEAAAATNEAVPPPPAAAGTSEPIAPRGKVGDKASGGGSGSGGGEDWKRYLNNSPEE